MEGKKILVVDDEENIRRLFKEDLEDEGYSVDTASDGIEALRMMEEKSYDMVILDLKMPKMDGIQTLNELRKRFGSIPVILCSAYGEFQHNLSSWLSDGYVVKSSDTRELKEMIRRIFEEKGV